MTESTTTEAAVDRALRLIAAGSSLEHAANNAGHFFSCSARLVKAAVKARQSTPPVTP